MTLIHKNISEEQLLSLLADNGKDGISLLYDKYAGALYGIVLKIVRSEEMAKDVLQDTFVKIWVNFGNYDQTKGRLFTWILNIARNKAIDCTRSKSFLTSNYDESDTEGRVQETYETKTDHIGLTEVIKQLTPEAQEVIEVVYFKGFTHSEAAEFLELPLGTVKTRVRNGLKDLRQLV